MTRHEGLDVTPETLPDGSVVLRVDGELDMATTPTLDEALAGAGSAPRLIVDLTDCTFLDSSAVRTLTAGARAAAEAGRSMSLVTADEGILRTLEIAGVEALLRVFPTLDDAL